MSFYSIFILLGSGSLLLSCSSPSPCRLVSIPFFLSSPPLSPSLRSVFFWADLSLSASMNTAYFHLNPRTWELWAKQEEQRTLLFHIQSNYSTYVIELSPLKVAALFQSQEHVKQTERNSGDGRNKTRNRTLFVSLMLASVIAWIDLVMNLSASVLIPAYPLLLLNPMSLIHFSRHTQRAVTISG